jgi:hypothetical protein
MPSQEQPPKAVEKKADSGQVGNIGQAVQLVKDYARQETLGPLKGAGRWIGFGIAGAFLLSLGSVFLVLGLLRLLQTEAPGTFGGNWTRLLPYVIAFGATVLVMALAASRIGKKPLNK